MKTELDEIRDIIRNPKNRFDPNFIQRMIDLCEGYSIGSSARVANAASVAGPSGKDKIRHTMMTNATS